jgi:hypothetical protein
VLETTGTVADQTLSILIDPGDTESFISGAALKRIKVKAVKQDEFSFMEMASGTKQKERLWVVPLTWESLSRGSTCTS